MGREPLQSRGFGLRSKRRVVEKGLMGRLVVTVFQSREQPGYLGNLVVQRPGAFANALPQSRARAVGITEEITAGGEFDVVGEIVDDITSPPVQLTW